MTRNARRPAADPTVAVGAVRVSKDDQTLSPEAQRDAMTRWCEAHGVRLAAVFEDLDVSGGAPLDKRPGMLAALDALPVHAAGLLLVAKRDRLSRDPITSAMIERLAQRHGARVASCAGEGTDADDPASVLMRRMVDAFSEYERQLIKARTRDALAVLRKRGVRLGGEALGWRRTDATDEAGRRVVAEVQDEAAAVRRILALRGEGRTLRAIAATLTGEGFQTKRGGAWFASTVRAVLAREAA